MFNARRKEISAIPGATEIGVPGDEFDHLKPAVWLYIGQNAIENGIPEALHMAEDGAVSLAQFQAQEEHRLAVYGKGFIEEQGQPSLKGIVSLLESNRQEIGKQYLGSTNGIGRFSKQNAR